MEIDVDQATESPARFDFYFDYSPKKSTVAGGGHVTTLATGAWRDVGNGSNGDGTIDIFTDNDNDNDYGNPTVFSADFGAATGDGYESDFPLGTGSTPNDQVFWRRTSRL